MEYIVEIYTTDSGKKPFREWHHGLRDAKVMHAIDMRLDRLRIGNWGNSEPVGEGVYEYKIDFGPGYRIYYGKIGCQLVLLLNGGDKRAQQRDIDKAKMYLKDYKKRGGGYV